MSPHSSVSKKPRGEVNRWLRLPADSEPFGYRLCDVHYVSHSHLASHSFDSLQDDGVLEIITNTRPVMGSACTEDVNETSNLRLDSGVLGQALVGIASSHEMASARTNT